MIAAQRSQADPSAQNTRMAGKLRNVAEKPEQQGDAYFRVRACRKAALPGEDINMQAHLWTCPAMRHVHETRAHRVRHRSIQPEIRLIVGEGGDGRQITATNV